MLGGKRWLYSSIEYAEAIDANNLSGHYLSLVDTPKRPKIIPEDGTKIVKRNNRGRSIFFPDDRDEERILQEVEDAFLNIRGRFE